MNIRIVAPSPRPYETKVFNADTGEEIKGITSITLSCDVNNAWVAEIKLIPASIEVVARSAE